MEETMEIALPHGEGTKAPLQAPNDAGYLILAATIDRRPAFLPRSRAKRALIKAVSLSLAELAQAESVVYADLFVARLVAPGEGDDLLRRRGLSPARFDVVLLIQTVDPAGALDLRAHPAYRRLRAQVSGAARDVFEVAARNVRRIADVAHTRSSVYLFNYFFADEAKLLVPVWEYTAGWFVENTALLDSEVLEPLAGERADYGIINHASWPDWHTFLPRLILLPSFRRFVLGTFAANDIAAQPIMYRLEARHSHRIDDPARRQTDLEVRSDEEHNQPQLHRPLRSACATRSRRRG
jgi:hypothetical protein